MASRHPVFSLPLILLISSFIPALAYVARDERQRRFPSLFQFPYIGRGDADHSFRHPYTPSPSGDAINAWFSLGTAVVTRGRSARDIVRLTSAAQANQGILYNAIRTETQNFNGYFDIQIDSVRESHEAADGMGFFFSRERPELGSAMGMTDTFQGLGIIIDTFSNSRTRHVPYLYAYTADGSKKWNPDTDGSDTELTRGCQLEMNTQVRIYVQFLDGDLHVGVAMNPRAPHRWHTCFKASGIRLPFSGGGYLAFAGETGHFFAHHEVHDAVFIDESDYGGGRGYQQQQYAQQKPVEERAPPPVPDKEEKLPPPVMDDPKARIHKGETAEKSLSGSLDLQVYDVFNTLTAELSKLGDKSADDTRMRLDGVRDVTAHLVKEMERQKTDVGELVDTLKHLKETAGDLTYSADRFTAQVRGLHQSLKTLRDKVDAVGDSSDDMHTDILEHHADITESSSTGGGGVLFMFFVLQMLLGCAFYFVNKITATSKKMSRMV